MEKSLEISKEADVKIEIKEGMAKISFDYQGKIGGAGAYGYVTTDDLIDAITAKTKNTVDDKIGELLKSALKKA